MQNLEEQAWPPNPKTERNSLHQAVKGNTGGLKVPANKVTWVLQRGVHCSSSAVPSTAFKGQPQLG
jgi:hypothetical protein